MNHCSVRHAAPARAPGLGRGIAVVVLLVAGTALNGDASAQYSNGQLKVSTVPGFSRILPSGIVGLWDYFSNDSSDYYFPPAFPYITGDNDLRLLKLNGTPYSGADVRVNLVHSELHPSFFNQPGILPGILFGSSYRYLSSDHIAGFRPGKWSLTRNFGIGSPSMDPDFHCGECIVDYIGSTTISWEVLPYVPPKNIVLVTHGWGSYEEGLPSVRNAVIDRLPSLGLSTSDTWVVNFRWQEAQNALYGPAFDKTEAAGLRLAQQLKDIVNDGRSTDANYDPVIHFIGHSLGTRVNAFAARELKGVATVEQVTILDAPLDSSPLFYMETLPKGTTKYLDNFYAEANLIPDGRIQFGEPIDGSGPCRSLEFPIEGRICNGLQAPGVGHTDIDDWYARRVGSSDWISPIIPGLNGWKWDLIWDPDPFVVDRRKAAISVQSVITLQGSVMPYVSDGGSIFFRMTPQSPVEFSFDLAIPIDAVELSFVTVFPTYAWAALSISFGDQILREFEHGEIESGETSIALNVQRFAGSSSRLTFLYDPLYSLESAEMGDFQFASLSPVPEPNVGALMLIGIASLILRRSNPIARRALSSFWGSAEVKSLTKTKTPCASERRASFDSLSRIHSA
jgi:hypothetical protein